MFQAPGRLTLQDCPEPVVGAGEHLIQVAAVGVCGSDIDIVRGKHAHLMPPIILGHEFCGVTRDGAFVVVNPMVGCGTCDLCVRGSSYLCPSRSTIGVNRPGGYAERVSVPARNAIPAPKLTPEQGVLVEPTATGLHAWNKVGRPQGKVVVIGAGSIGLCLVQALIAHGVSEIDVVDIKAERLALAKQLGAARVFNAWDGEGYDAVFDTVGSQQTRTDALARVVPGGSVALIGLYASEIQISARQLVVGDRTVCGCFAYTDHEFVEAVRLVEGFDTRGLTRVPIQQAESAYANLLLDAGWGSGFKVGMFF